LNARGQPGDRGCYANEHAAGAREGRSHCPVDLKVRVGRRLVAPVRELVEDHGQERSTANQSKAIRVDADDDAVLESDLVRRGALDLLPQDRRLAEECLSVVEDSLSLVPRSGED
jgi:hypothetical protein